MTGTGRRTAYARPSTVSEALVVRSEHPDWVVLAGGTDLMVELAAGEGPDGVLDLFGLPDLAEVRSARGSIRIGASATFAGLRAEPLVAEQLPLLAAAAGAVGSVPVQARGTVGGNVVTASPVGDLLPGLLALDATVEVASTRGRRRIRYESFCTGYRRTALAPDELLVAVEVPVPEPGTVQHWRKVATHGTRGTTKVSLAACARLDGRGRLAHLALALGAVADRPVRLNAVEQELTGGPPAAATHLDVVAGITPIDDVRSTAAYRRAVAARLVHAFLADLVPG